MVVAVDFDGTLHQGKWPGIGFPMHGARLAMKDIKDYGCYIVIWTCRQGDALTDAINWLLEEGIPFDRVNENRPEHIEFFKGSSRKVHADLYIDDRQVGGLPPWGDILNEVKKAKDSFDEKMKQYENIKQCNKTRSQGIEIV